MNIDQAMSKIKQHLKMNDSDLKDLMKITSYDLSRAKRAKTYGRLPMAGYLELSDKIGVGLKNLRDADIDYEAMREHFFGNKKYLPKRYQNYRHSKAIGVHNLLKSSQIKIFDSQIEEIKKELQITDEILTDKELNVGSQMPLDVFEKLKERGCDEKVFQYLGKTFCAVSLENTSTENLKKMSLQGFVANSIDNIAKKIEKNTSYSIQKMTKKEAIIRAQTREETKDALKIKRFGDSSYAEYARGYCEEMFSQYDSKNRHPQILRVSKDFYEYFIAL